MRVFLSIQKPRNWKLHQSFHNLLKTKVGITLSNPSKILTIFVSKTVKYESCEFVHSLTIMIFRISFKKSINNTSKTVKIVSFYFLFLFRQMYLVFRYRMLLKSFLCILYFKLFIEKFAIRFGPHCIFLD
jgi:hypothetical protein